MKKRNKGNIVILSICVITIVLITAYRFLNDDAIYLNKIDESLSEKSLTVHDIEDSQLIIKLKMNFESIKESNVDRDNSKILIESMINNFKEKFSNKAKCDEIILNLMKFEKLDDKIKYIDSLIENKQ